MSVINSISTTYYHKSGMPANTHTFKADKMKEMNKRIINGIEVTEPIQLTADISNGKEVPQGAAFIASFAEKRTTLQTFGLGSCIAVTLYDPKTKVGALAHIDTLSKAKSLSAVITRLNNIASDMSTIEANIIGGKKGLSETMFETIKAILDGLQITIKEINIGERPDRPRGIILDLRDGQVYGFVGESPTNEAVNSQSWFAPMKSSLMNESLQIEIY